MPAAFFCFSTFQGRVEHEPHARRTLSGVGPREPERRLEHGGGQAVQQHRGKAALGVRAEVQAVLRRVEARLGVRRPPAPAVERAVQRVPAEVVELGARHRRVHPGLPRGVAALGGQVQVVGGDQPV